MFITATKRLSGLRILEKVSTKRLEENVQIPDENMPKSRFPLVGTAWALLLNRCYDPTMRLL